MIFFLPKFLKPVCLILGGKSKSIKTLVATIQPPPPEKWVWEESSVWQLSTEHQYFLVRDQPVAGVGIRVKTGKEG